MGFGSEREGPRLVRRGNRSRGTQGGDRAGAGVTPPAPTKTRFEASLSIRASSEESVYVQTPIDHLQHISVFDLRRTSANAIPRGYERRAKPGYYARAVRSVQGAAAGHSAGPQARADTGKAGNGTRIRCGAAEDDGSLCSILQRDGRRRGDCLCQQFYDGRTARNRGVL